MIYSYVTDGTILLGESADSASSNFSYSGSESVSLSDSGLSTLTIGFVASGLARISGKFVSRFVFFPLGGVVLSYLASAIVSKKAIFSSSFSFDVYNRLEISYDFSFDVGQLPNRTFRVVGVDYNDCENIPFCAKPNGKNRMFQELIARNISDVCSFLTNVNWTWPIAEIQRSVEPIDAFFVDSSTGLNVYGNRPPDSNRFLPVPFHQIPKCIPFTIIPTKSISFGLSVSIIAVKKYIASGSIVVYGNVKLFNSITGFGFLSMSGSAYILPAYHQLFGLGSIAFDGDGLLTYSYRQHTSSGGLHLQGESVVVSPFQKFLGLGLMEVYGVSQYIQRLNFRSSGSGSTYPSYAGLTVGGTSKYPIIQLGSGSATIYGMSLVIRNTYRYHMNGSASIVGSSVIISPYSYYQASGLTKIYGNIRVVKASYAIEADDSMPILIGGFALTDDSSDGNFRYSSIVDSIEFGESAESSIISLLYVGSGIVSTYGSLDTDIYKTPDVSMGIFSNLEFLEVRFREDYLQTIATVATTINTPCASCDAIPDTLYLRHNLEYGSVLKDFLVRNDYSIPKSIPMMYSPRTKSWKSSLHYRGVGRDNYSSTENWQINIEWSCISQYAENYLSSAMWKFSIYIKKSDDFSNDDDTRLLILFPSKELCSQISNFGVDFTFSFNFRDDYVVNQLYVPIDTYNYFDTLGVFKGDFWDSNRFTCRILDSDIVEEVNTIDISAISTQPQTQFYV